MSGISYASTLYMGPSETYTNLQAAMSAMSTGDTLIIRDGTYTGSSNVIVAGHVPPNGTSNAYTTIRAENPGSVIFDGSGTTNMFYDISGINYIVFSGIVWQNGGSVGAVYLGNANHVKFQQCGIRGDSTSTSGMSLHTCSYMLIEDSYIWGSFFYGINPYHCYHLVLRRIVGRLDRSNGAWAAPFAVYGCTDVEVQNCIAIDCDQTSLYTVTSENIYGFYNPNNSDGTERANYRGCIALNIHGPSKASHGFFISSDCADYYLENCAIWGTDKGLWDRSGKAVINHCTFGLNTPDSGWGTVISPRQITNSILTNNSTYGIENGSTTMDYNCLYSNLPNYSASSMRGTHDYCTENSNSINPRTNSLLYLTRIENNSTLNTKASDGLSIGATIMYRIGVTGTLWGEMGYNTTTSEKLWPFPNETVIRNKMMTYSTGGSNGSRGFCADGQTLTRYIFEYLGNTIPTGLYGISKPTGVTITILN